MTVYVERLMRHVAKDARTRAVGARGGHLWCHMLADTDLELHALAAAIGLRREWFQPGSSPHYDPTPSRRALAVQHGAVEVTSREMVVLIRARGLQTETPRTVVAIGAPPPQTPPPAPWGPGRPRRHPKEHLRGELLRRDRRWRVVRPGGRGESARRGRPHPVAVRRRRMPATGRCCGRPLAPPRRVIDEDGGGFLESRHEPAVAA